MTRSVTLIVIGIAVAAAIGVYKFKLHSGEQLARIAELRAEIAQEEEAISILKAEWNHLNQPGRIQQLTERFLDIGKMEVHQIVSIEAVPMRPLDLNPINGNPLGGFAGGDERTIQ